MRTEPLELELLLEDEELVPELELEELDEEELEEVDDDELEELDEELELEEVDDDELEEEEDELEVELEPALEEAVVVVAAPLEVAEWPVLLDAAVEVAVDEL